ncbi:MAG: hypothetical protein AVDCRST_MAG59-1612 [uncultured Thermomicrobiales bacterium]|uniref:Uncharacterized protein n=1 Tax=uncultured Thermomicrobiales bacterium TaxID=1645740 RepID=A0A6J4UIX2_9BACT|nr:MAG: hypothetical protein AVDCRST_MAG59-1612 [uncultured Thermomicrobiales bacterium]
MAAASAGDATLAALGRRRFGSTSARCAEEQADDPPSSQAGGETAGQVIEALLLHGNLCHRRRLTGLSPSATVGTTEGRSGRWSLRFRGAVRRSIDDTIGNDGTIRTKLCRDGSR